MMTVGAIGEETEEDLFLIKVISKGEDIERLSTGDIDDELNDDDFDNVAFIFSLIEVNNPS